MYVKKNVLKSLKTAPGAPENRDPNIVIVGTEDVLTAPGRDGKGIKYLGNFVFKPGTYAILIYATPSSIKITKGVDGDEDAMGVTQGLEFAHPGDELEINEYIQNNIGKSVLAFVKTGSCGSGSPFYKVVGSICTPLQLKLEGQNDNDATKNTFKYEAFKKTNALPGFYEGTLTFETVLSTVVQDAVIVDATPGSGEYQLTDGSAAPIALTDIENGSHGDTVTLKGSGGTYPSTIAAAEAKFELLDGADWTALAGESITLKAYKNGPLATDIIWIEVSRQ